MCIFKKFSLYLLVFFLLFLIVFVESGFCRQKIIKTEYFTIYYDQGCNLADIANKLNVEHFLHIDIFSQNDNSQSIDSIISSLFDSIYLEVSDILDIHIYSFHATIKILSDKEKMADVLEKYLKKRINMPSYYFQSKNTIYISFDDLTLGMLAHEIAHAIISHYFVVAPSEKVQEVLSGYVEYSIRKSTGTLTEIMK